MSREEIMSRVLRTLLVGTVVSFGLSCAHNNSFGTQLTGERKVQQRPRTNRAHADRAPRPLQLLMIDGEHVAHVRDSLRRGERQFEPALAALEADANRMLSVAPMSVMDKNVTPPSGDKHDYMSQAP